MEESKPKRTIHSFVQEIGRQLCEANQARVSCEEPPIVMADGTKTHASVNQDSSQVGRDVNTSNSSLVGDADRGIRLNLTYETRPLDLVHAVKDSLYKLWAEGMNRQEREAVSIEMKQLLYTLINSVKKHLEDDDTEALKNRIENTVKGLIALAEDLKLKGYPKTVAFIKSNARFMVTFAKLALKNIRIPYTSNAIERLMGEVSKRCKHKWMHWSTEGLENILQIILVRYTNPQFYKQFWKTYIHPSQYQFTLTTRL